MALAAALILTPTTQKWIMRETTRIETIMEHEMC
jgi:hypothetical protein